MTTGANGEGSTKRPRKVWIDQDLCTGDGLCEQLAPKVFVLLDDGLSYVIDPEGKVLSNGGPSSVADLPEDDKTLEDVIDSAEECPGECIFLLDGDGNAIGLGLASLNGD